MSLAEIKTAPYQVENDIADMIAQAKEQARAYNEGPMPLDEAAAMYDPQEFSENLVFDETDRHAPRSSDLRANAAATETTEVTTNSLVEDLLPAETTKKGIMGRIKNRMSQARETIKDVFHKEKPTSVERATRRKALASVVGSVAVGLVMIAAVPSAQPSQTVEKAIPTVTTIAQEVRTPEPANNVAKATNQAFAQRAEVVRFVAEHPKEAKDFFTWANANPGISEAQMKQQFDSLHQSV